MASTRTLQENFPDIEEGLTSASVWNIVETNDDDDDDVPPAPFNSAEFDADNEWKRAVAAAGRDDVDTTVDDDADDDVPPAPFNSVEFDADNEWK